MYNSQCTTKKALRTLRTNAAIVHLEESTVCVISVRELHF